MIQTIVKSSGEREPFSSEKFKRSLLRAGASQDQAETLAQDVIAHPELDTTYKIYQYAFNKLRSINRTLAARYSLKNALFDLGPEGFLFERFMAELFWVQGYTTQVDQTLPGKCVNHEIDIVMEKDGKRYMAECKFHNSRGLKTDVKVALYVKARYLDLRAQWEETRQSAVRCDGFWLLTNTQLTSEAIQYGECAGLLMLGWAYPEQGSIAQLIDQYGLHPITSLTSLTTQQKHLLLGRSILFAWEIVKRPDLLKELGLSSTQEQEIIADSHALSTRV